MLQIEYPIYKFKIKEENNREFIFDVIRKKWVRLTPEEWVRQNFIQYLLQVKKYPASLIAVEKEIVLVDLRKRCDIVIYKNGNAYMIIECKEKNVALSEAVLQQILRYNISLQVSILVVTNGNETYAAQIREGVVTELNELPIWK